MNSLVAAGVAVALAMPGEGREGVAPDTARSVRARADTITADTAVTVRFGGYVDLYYAYDLHRPRTLDRGYTTTAARHNEFNVNLAFLEALVSGPRVRGRLAVQFGTSVQANYAGEPRVGQVSGPDVSRFIQEAFAGVRLHDGLWVDGGVFLAPFGAESWISRDNPVYTRSLIVDNSPYYESGLRVTWRARPTLELQAHIINGWQNVSETNADKALALRADWTVTPSLTLTYDTFLGNEQPDSLSSLLRQFHEGIVRWTPDARTSLWATFDYGRQSRAGGAGADAGSASWRGFAVLARRVLTPTLALGARIEGYSDPEQVIVNTGAQSGLSASGASLNADVRLASRVVWRTEGRVLRAREAVFAGERGEGARSRENGVIVSSLALTF